MCEGVSQYLAHDGREEYEGAGFLGENVTVNCFNFSKLVFDNVRYMHEHQAQYLKLKKTEQVVRYFLAVGMQH